MKDALPADKVKVTVFNNTQIYLVVETGKFAAQVESDWITAPSLAEIKRRLAPAGTEIKSFSAGRWTDLIDPQLVVGMDARGNYKVKGQSQPVRSDMYVWDDDLVLALQKNLTERADFDARMVKEFVDLLKSRGHVIKPQDFKRKPVTQEKAGPK